MYFLIDPVIKLRINVFHQDSSLSALFTKRNASRPAFVRFILELWLVWSTEVYFDLLLRVMYSAQADQADSSIHRFKSFINTTYSPTLTLFAFHANKKQYLDTFHKQKKNVIHIWMHNDDFGILISSVHYSTKLQIAKSHNNAKNKGLSVQGSFEFSYKLYLAQNLQICLGTTH